MRNLRMYNDESQKRTGKVHILKKTTGPCPSRSYYTMNSPLVQYTVHSSLHGAILAPLAPVPTIYFLPTWIYINSAIFSLVILPFDNCFDISPCLWQETPIIFAGGERYWREKPIYFSPFFVFPCPCSYSAQFCVRLLVPHRVKWKPFFLDKYIL